MNTIEILERKPDLATGSEHWQCSILAFEIHPLWSSCLVLPRVLRFKRPLLQFKVSRGKDMVEALGLAPRKVD